MKKNIFLLSLLLFLCLIVGGRFSWASSYDFYVDSGCDESDADGSKDNPFCTIGDALDEASDGDSIYINDGTYDEDVDLQNGISLVGESNDDTVIEGKIEMDDGSSIKTLTVTEGKINVLIKEDADAEISDCIISNASKNGIEAEEGSGKLTVDDTNIYGNAKGLYIEAGKQISITDTKIHDNDEEGLDIRGGVSGTVANNSIYDNGEGGIELIVGKANLSIKSNSIKNNESSGIATQFYSYWNNLGEVNITSNTISGNGRYGVDCNAPSGGADKMQANYWSKSITLSKNKIEDNKKGESNDYCGFSSSEEKTDETSQTKNTTTEISDADRKAAIEAASSGTETEEKSQADLEIEERLSAMEDEFNKNKEEVHVLVNSMNDESGWKVFLVDYSPKEVARIKEFIQQMENNQKELDTLAAKTGNPEVGSSIESLRSTIETELKSMQSVLDQIDEVFSLFGWFRQLTFKLFS